MGIRILIPHSQIAQNRIHWAVQLFAIASAVTLVLCSGSQAANRSFLPIEHIHRDTLPAKISEGQTAPLRCFCPEALSPSESPLNLQREHPWSLPTQSLRGKQAASFNVLVLRVSFPLETPDDPRTTGRGKMDYRTYDEFFAEYGHGIDPAPHDSLYFDSHMRALKTYYTFVSQGSVTIDWDVWPPGDTSTYELPKPMAYYGNPDSVEARLTEFFTDCVKLADTVEPGIVFRNYNSVMIFHAGADRQNDIGFPLTPNDLFTGFIKVGTDIVVDNGDTVINTGLFMPESASQDNRATALNAVMAHEFGHQLGLVDLYNTRNFFTQIGDFALMDNNGFGIGIDFGFPGVFQTFGAFPVVMSAWSRAYLGFSQVVDLPMGTPYQVIAASLDTTVNPANASKIVRIPISRYEYYLIENRRQITNAGGNIPGAVADSITGVIQGTTINQLTRQLVNEYDFLLPGSGLLIYHVDESVAFEDADGDGLPNFQDNDLQWDSDRRFIRLVEADGYVDFGGFYYKGTGNQDDFWNPGIYDAFTPNSVPATFSSSGAHTHIALSVDSSDVVGHRYFISAENQRRVPKFPVWVGTATNAVNPIVAEIDSAAGEEIISVSGKRITITAKDGRPGWNFVNALAESLFVASTRDTLQYKIGGDSTAINQQLVYPINLFAVTSEAIAAGPVLAHFGTGGSDTSVIAVGAGDTLYLFGIYDSNPFGAPRPDSVWKINIGEPIIDLMFTDSLLVLSETNLNGYTITEISGPTASPQLFGFGTQKPIGFCATDGVVVTLTQTTTPNKSQLTAQRRGGAANMFELESHYGFGPIATDFDRDGLPEVAIGAMNSGAIALVTVDTNFISPTLSNFNVKEELAPVTGALTIADLDNDNYPDIIVPSNDMLYAFNQQLTLLNDFPTELRRNVNTSRANYSGVVCDADDDGAVDLLLGASLYDTLSGALFSYSKEITFGFPLPVGAAPRGAPVIVNNGTDFSLANVGVDGFLYNWKTDAVASSMQWRMGAGNPEGTNYFDPTVLGAPQGPSGGIVESSFYSYPNPVTGSSTTLRYTLGKSASAVSLCMYTFSGQRVKELSGPTGSGFPNEVTLDCAGLTPGVYRIVLKASFSDGDETSFTDIAVVN